MDVAPWDWIEWGERYDDTDDDNNNADLSVNGHTEIPDKSSGSTSRSAARCCQVHSTLIL